MIKRPACTLRAVTAMAVISMTRTPTSSPVESPEPERTELARPGPDVNLSSLTLRALEIFVSVAASGSMTAAAERLGVSQSAVSQAIRALEEAIGRKLFDRSIRPPALTLIGTAVLEHATELTQRMRALEQTIRSAATPQMPLLRIGMANTFAVTAGPGLIERIRHLARSWAITSGPSETSIEGVVERRVDVVATFDETTLPDEFVALPILSEPYFLALPAGFAGRFDTLQQLSTQLAMLRYGRQLHVSRQIETYLERENVIAPERYRFDSIDAVIAMVAAGIGWTLTTPLCLLKSPALAPRLACRLLPGRPLRRRLVLIGRRKESGAMTELIQREAIDVLRTECLPQLRRMLPEISGEVEIGG
jgi:DNA-binding transcriptional LysR family regulator